MFYCGYRASICQSPQEKVHTADHTALFTHCKALSLMWKDPYLMCMLGCYKAGAHSSEQERLQLSSPPITHWEPFGCVCAHTVTSFRYVCVWLFDRILSTRCASVCVCARLCVSTARPWGYRQLGDSADGITYDMWVTEWVCVYVRVCVCMHVCVRVSVHLGSPLIGRGSLCSPRPTGESAGRLRQSSARPAYLQPLSACTAFRNITMSHPVGFYGLFQVKWIQSWVDSLFRAFNVSCGDIVSDLVEVKIYKLDG